MFSFLIRLQDSLISNISGRKVLEFLHRDIYQKKIASKNTAVGCVWPGVRSHAQTCRNLSGSDFGWSGGSTVTSKNSSE